MRETCRHCRLPKARDREDIGECYCHDVDGLGDELDALVCDVRADAYRRGLREGAAVAKANAPVRFSDGSVFRGIVDWSEFDAEIARLTGGEHG